MQENEDETDTISVDRQIHFLFITTQTSRREANMSVETVQPVYIRSKHNNGFLTITSPHDASRNGVYLVSDLPGCSTGSFNLGVAFVGISIPMGPDMTIENAKWFMIPNGNGDYQITNVKYNEPLYAAADDLAYNKDCRKVFTWRPRNNSQGYWKYWTLKLNNGYYTIQHADYEEYLFAADHPSTGYVFTWREEDKKEFSDQFYWQLINA